MTGVAVVIGADKGIGLEIVKALAARGETDVVAVCLGDGADAAAHVGAVIDGVNVTSGADVARMAARLGESFKTIRVLFHISGIMSMDSLGELDFAQAKLEFDVNALGPLRTVEACLPMLTEGSKLGIVTSRIGSLSDNSSGGQYAYRLSKVAANMAGLNLHHDLSKRGIAVRMLHPGMVKTDLVKIYPGEFNYITPAQAASGLIARMDELTLESSGEFRHANGELLPW
jgi:NAD(P)-dependent dehydrogenase (short-subunit alcohol dehydrogenase family)